MICPHPVVPSQRFPHHPYKQTTRAALHFLFVFSLRFQLPFLRIWFITSSCYNYRSTLVHGATVHGATCSRNKSLSRCWIDDAGADVGPATTQRVNALSPERVYNKFGGVDHHSKHYAMQRKPRTIYRCCWLWVIMRCIGILRTLLHSFSVVGTDACMLIVPSNNFIQSEQWRSSTFPGFWVSICHEPERCHAPHHMQVTSCRTSTRSTSKGSSGGCR